MELQILRPYRAVKNIPERDSSTSSERQHHRLPHSLCHAERCRSISIFLHSLLTSFSEIALCHDFPLRCNVSVLLFGKSIACIAIRVGVVMELQMFSPYRAGRAILEGDSSTSSEWQHHRLPHSLCHAERCRSISIFLHSLLTSFSEIALCHDFPLRCNVSVLLFGKSIACIAIRVGVVMELQMFSPYGAGNVVRCSCVVVREMRWNADDTD